MVAENVEEEALGDAFGILLLKEATPDNAIKANIVNNVINNLYFIRFTSFSLT